jgi:hypothetical protein
MRKPLSKKVLIDAAKLIHKKGLAKHAFKNGLGEYCVTGAVREIRYGSAYSDGGNSGMSAFDVGTVRINDKPDTYKEDAVLFLLLCAEAFDDFDKDGRNFLSD